VGSRRKWSDRGADSQIGNHRFARFVGGAEIGERDRACTRRWIMGAPAWLRRSASLSLGPALALSLNHPIVP